MDRELPKGLNWPAEGPYSTLYLGLYQGQCPFAVSSEAKVTSNLLGSPWLLGVKKGACV